MQNLLNKIKNFFITYSVIFTVTTVCSSFIQLQYGQLEDTNFHILTRAVVVFIGVEIIYLEKNLKFKSKILSFLVPYIISMNTVFLVVFISGFFEPVHPNGYRDIFFNFTAMYLIIELLIFIYKNVKQNTSIK